MTWSSMARSSQPVSQDRAGVGLGVTSPEEDCRAPCERRDWTVVEVYADDDRLEHELAFG